MKRGLFIVIDGLDGSGKTTQVKLLAEHIFNRSKSNSVFLTREPYSTALYAKIRAALRTTNNPHQRAELFLKLFVADRKLHLRDITRLLDRGVHVVTDRYKYSTLAYQHAQGIPFEKLVEAHKGMLVPDCAIIIDLPVDALLKRITNGGRKDAIEVFEQEAFMKKLRAQYRGLSKRLPREPIAIVSGVGSVEKVFARVKKVVDVVFS